MVIVAIFSAQRKRERKKPNMFNNRYLTAPHEWGKSVLHISSMLGFVRRYWYFLFKLIHFLLSVLLYRQIFTSFKWKGKWRKWRQSSYRPFNSTTILNSSKIKTMMKTFDKWTRLLRNPNHFFNVLLMCLPAVQTRALQESFHIVAWWAMWVYTK